MQTVSGKSIHKRAAKVFVEMPVRTSKSISCLVTAIDKKPAAIFMHGCKPVQKNIVDAGYCNKTVPEIRNTVSHPVDEHHPKSENEDATLTLVSVGLMLVAVTLTLLALFASFITSDFIFILIVYVAVAAFVALLGIGVVAIAQHHDHFGLAIFSVIVDIIPLVIIGVMQFTAQGP